MLVTKALLLRRKENVIACWLRMRAEAPIRFNTEIMRSLLHHSYDPANWENAAFAGLVEQVETMAIQRGVARWEP